MAKAKAKTGPSRLEDSALAAATAFPKDRAAAGKMLGNAIWIDHELTLEATRWAHQESLRRLLQTAYEAIRAGLVVRDAQIAPASTGDGHSSSDTHPVGAAPHPIPDGEARGGVSQDHTTHAGPSGTVQAAVRANAIVTRLTIMDTLRTPLGQLYAEANYNDLVAAQKQIPVKQGQLVFHQRLIERILPHMEIGDTRVTVKQRFTVEEFESMKHAAENVNFKNGDSDA